MAAVFESKGRCALTVSLLAALGFSLTAAAADAPALKFDFGPGPAREGRVRVAPDTLYSKDRGYGFEPGSDPRTRLFSVALPEGNYDVRVSFGDREAGSTNTVKAECRRLMLERVVTRPGEFVTRAFTVNVRTPALPGGGAVRLKEREKGTWQWDDKLTLEFNGTRPAVTTVEIAPATNATTVFLLGDSTVTDQAAEPWNSWGQMLTRFFQPGVAVANHAESGESLKSSLGAGRVKKVLSSIRAGDYLFVQFGHNDMKDRATNALTIYRLGLELLVLDARFRGATPVLVTSLERMRGVEHETLAGYPQTVRDVAREKHVPLIDLHAMSLTFYRALGANLKAAFQDGTHHNAYGSYELARCVVRGIRENKLPLAQLLVKDVPDFDPVHPDPVAEFTVPPSPGRSNVKPDGN